MSLQLSVRFFEGSLKSEYESNLLSHCYELFESVKDLLGVPNFLAEPFTSNEEELYEQIEEELGGEPDGDGFDEFEENIENELGVRGQFFPVSELINSISAYREYFQSKSKVTFDLGYNRNAGGNSLVEDLSYLQEELERLPDGKARLVLN